MSFTSRTEVKLSLVLFPLITTGIALMMYHNLMRLMVGEYEFSRWMLFTISNKSFLWFGCIGLIGGCAGYTVSKLVKVVNR